MSNLDHLSNLVQLGKAKDVISCVQELIDNNVNLETILNDGLLAGMNEVGHKWKLGKAFIPEVLIASRALNAGMELLERYMTTDTNKETIIIGTVKGDMHDIGKNLVGMMLKSKGFKVIDLGTNVDAQTFVNAVIEHKARYICMSALLTTTMMYFKEVVHAINEANLKDQVTLFCGGAPVTEQFAHEVGCDYYTNDAMSCADLIEELVGA